MRTANRLTRILIAACVAASGTLALGVHPALAGPPAGSSATCPPKFQATTLQALLDLAERVGVPESHALTLFERVNKNEDSWICLMKLPGDVASYNFIDNQAIGLDRA